MNLIDLFDLDHVGSQARQCANFRESQYSPCEDDCEITAPYIGLLPGEAYWEGYAQAQKAMQNFLNNFPYSTSNFTKG